MPVCMTPAPPHSNNNLAAGLQVLLGRINESTSSAWSRIHFDHWKAIRKSDELTTLTCTQLNLVAATGIPPSHWGTGLQVLLEMVP
jgi:hypothetical protein